MSILEIEELEERLRQAMLASHVAEINRLISERLMFVTPDGATIGKPADLEAHRTGLIRVSSLSASNRRIELFGAVAVVNVEMLMAGSFAGAAFSGRYRYTRIWHDDGNQTQVVAGHVCAIA